MRPADAAVRPSVAMKHLDHTTYAKREETALEHAVEEHWDEGCTLLKHLPKAKGQSDAFFPLLDDAVFVGHIMTDLDSIAGAIGAAELYGGVPARASEINTETQFALEHWGVDLPPPVEDLLAERCVLVPNVRFSPVHRFQHLIASPFN